MVPWDERNGCDEEYMPQSEGFGVSILCYVPPSIELLGPASPQL